MSEKTITEPTPEERLAEVLREMITMSVEAALAKPFSIFRWRELEAELLDHLPDLLQAVVHQCDCRRQQIVREHNAHDALVEALGDCVAFIECEVADQRSEGLFVTPDEIDAGLLAKARAALALAKGADDE